MAMYSVTVRREFGGRIRLALPGGSVVEHRHDYHLAATVEGPELDGDGFLVDITLLERELDRLRERLGGHDLLNDDPLLEGENPTLERLAAAVAGHLAEKLQGRGLSALEVEAFEGERPPAPGPSARARIELDGAE
jgi:6-pyruvoyl-tetrahydropterin synthase